MVSLGYLPITCMSEDDGSSVFGKESDRVIPIRILKPALANLVDHRIYYYGFQSYRNFAHYSSACSETAASSPDWLQRSTSRGNPRSAVACNNLLRRRRKLRKQPPKAAQTGPATTEPVPSLPQVSNTPSSSEAHSSTRKLSSTRVYKKSKPSNASKTS
ncbi:hypothetical protein FRC03_010553 [Tulasnella sp. 419]|nr:hypothetical protein FRC03_010553 [Tulasnella sp. 419]